MGLMVIINHWVTVPENKYNSFLQVSTKCTEKGTSRRVMDKIGGLRAPTIGLFEGGPGYTLAGIIHHAF